MKNNIIIYCKDSDDILETGKYIKNNYEFDKAIVSKQNCSFVGYFNKLNNIECVRIRLITPSDGTRGIKGNIGLLSEKMEDYLIENINVLYEHIMPTINDFGRGIEGRKLDRCLIAPIDMLGKILRDDISYLLIDDFRDSYDVNYVTNDVVSALSYLRKYNSNRIHICRQDDLNCEVNCYDIEDIDGWRYLDIVKYISKLTT